MQRVISRFVRNWGLYICLTYRERCGLYFFFFSSRRRHTRSDRDWSSDVCSSDLGSAGLRPSFTAQYETFANVGGKLTKVTLGNTGLKPAHSGELELGANIDFLSRFSLDYSYSRKNTTDQIILVPLSAAAGYRYQWQNAASLLGKTHELSLRVILADRPELAWQGNSAADLD